MNMDMDTGMGMDMDDMDMGPVACNKVVSTFCMTVTSHKLINTFLGRRGEDIKINKISYTLLCS